MDAPFVTSVFHPSDFSDSSEVAFVHALAVSLHRQTKLTLLHVVPADEAVDRYDEFPKVRKMLEKWGYLEHGKPTSALYQGLGMKVRKVNVRRNNILKAAANYLEKHPADLIVLTTKATAGRKDASIAERLGRETKTMTLFLPENIKGFVSKDNGAVTLGKIMVAIGGPDPEAAIRYASRAASFAPNGGSQIFLVHVGAANSFPQIDLPPSPGVQWEKVSLEGRVVEELVNFAGQKAINLMVMTTEGHNGILDILRGSITEQVLRKAHLPLLAVPKLMSK